MEVVQEVVLLYLVATLIMEVAVVLVHIEKDPRQSQHHKRLQFRLVQVVQKEVYYQLQDHHLILEHQ